MAVDVKAAASEVERLSGKLSLITPTLDGFRGYYRADRTLQNIGVSLPPKLAALQTTLGWCHLVSRAYEERLDLDSIEVTTNDELTTLFRRWFSIGDVPELASKVHNEALSMGRGYVVVGTDELGNPLFTAESPRHLYVEHDPRTQAPRSAVRLYGPQDERRATLYGLNTDVFLIQRNGVWLLDPDAAPLEHNLGALRVVPFINRPGIGDFHGGPEFADVMQLQDAVSRTLTNLGAAQESMAVPQRVIAGAEPKDFVDPSTGEMMSTYQAYMANILALTNDNARVQQFTAADLSNFTGVVMNYARQAAALSGLPLSYFGVASEANPASGDAIQADDGRLVRRAERISRSFGPSWCRVFSLAARLTESATADELVGVEARWRDASIQTPAQVADAVLKLYSASNDTEGPLITRDKALQMLAFTAEERVAIASELEVANISRLLNGGTADAAA